MKSFPIGYHLQKETNGIGFKKDMQHKPPSKVIYDEGESHLLTIASTGAGKGRGNIIPTSLKYKGALIILDIKGEAARVTAEARKKFGEVFIVDPFKKVTDNPAKYNPMDSAFDLSFVEQQGIMLAKAFQHENGSISKDVFWDNMAHELLSAACIHALTTEKNFSAMRQLLCADDVVYNIATQLDAKKITNKLAAELFSSFISTPDLTRGGILSTAHQYLGILGDPAVTESLNGPSSFNVPDLLAGKPMTIYFVIPPNKLKSFSTLLRLWFSSLLNLFSERETKPKIPTLLILDECYSLGRMENLLASVSLMRSYGLRIWCFFQSLSQIKEHYKTDWMSLLDNADTIQAYGFKHYPTAKEMSEIIGCMSPAQLLKMSKDHAVLMRTGHPVEVMKRLDYLKDSLYKNTGFDRNNFYDNSKT